MKIKHGCGCITEDKDGVIIHLKNCEIHREGNVWIAIQHKNKMKWLK